MSFSSTPDNHFEKEQKEASEFLKIDTAMIDLFRMELENQSRVISDSLVRIENAGSDSKIIEVLMRAAHSIKGAGRVVRLEPVVVLSHDMEECFLEIQKKNIPLDPSIIDLLLEGVDIFSQLAKLPQTSMIEWLLQKHVVMERIRQGLKNVGKDQVLSPQKEEREPSKSVQEVIPKLTAPTPPLEKVIRVTAQNLNKLMGLAGESMVESRWLQPFTNALLKLKKDQGELVTYLEQMREYFERRKLSRKTDDYLLGLQQRVDHCRKELVDRLVELESFITRHASLSDRLYREVVDSRMRPFSDGVEGFSRMVRDLGRRLNKKVRLKIIGLETPVDREILEKLEAPLGHLIRNGVDHGIETPEERIAKGKPEEGTVTLIAEHRAGMLAITVSDDGKGISLEKIKQKILDSKLVKAELIDSLNERELLDFLFLPGFTTTSEVTDISGRGVGLDVVRNMIQEVSGDIHVVRTPDKGTSFHLQLPLTLSVLRALIVEISKESFAFPLSRIDHALTIQKAEIEKIENREYFCFQGKNIGLVPAAQVMEFNLIPQTTDTLSVVVLSDHSHTYGIVVDQFKGERELVVQELDPRLGKVQDINSGALLEDGAPVLVIDVDDLVRSVDYLLTGTRLHHFEDQKDLIETRKKKILVVDDSVTVRDVECRLLRNHGYEVETAINGMDAWNAVRIGHYDLVISDIDMPRMNGIELVKAIRADPKLKELPILIVSYKEREEDRNKGIEAGANYYLTKSSFHDETLIKVVEELVGL